MALGSCFTVTRIKVLPGTKWIRTDNAFLPYLCVLPRTLWLYRVSEDEMLRLVYDKHGRVIWQYRMLCIKKSRNTRTRHMDEYLKACAGKPYFFI